ncbi:hypothetical protein KXS11_12280 [Plantibacter flavus]|uniref:hypothetical protein n=1 Tax=Plantibacter flavus TaxID=150123 RepID=UPI003F14D57E
MLELGSAFVMLAAMIDIASGAGLVHPFVWALVLVAAAVASAARLRVVARRTSPDMTAVAASVVRDPVPGHRTAMVVHTSGGLVIMAALVCVMAAHTGAGVYANTGISSEMHHAGGMSIGGLLLAAATAGYLALSTKLALDAIRSGRRLVAVELVSMAVSVAAMGIAAAL